MGLLRPPACHAAFLVALAAAFLASPARTQTPQALRKLDPRLHAQASTPTGETFSVWVSFHDKGERDEADLAARLVKAEQSLTARARARRVRAGLAPLVDYRDLRLEPAYLDGLRSHGLTPYGASRWLNGVAVRVTGTRLHTMAELPFVQRIAPVPRAVRSMDPTGPSESVHSDARKHAGDATDAGLNNGALEQLRVTAVHDSGYIGIGVLIAVLDNGFNFFQKHEALRTQTIPIERQRDFVRGIASVQDTTDFSNFNHGTWVLGCIAGKLPGTYLGSGHGAEFALARTEVNISETPVEMVYWGMGVEWADSLGADIISSSLGYSLFDDPHPDYAYADMDGRTTTVSRAAQIAASKGMLVVTAVGNEGNSPWHYLIAPSDVHGDSLIGVGAVDTFGTVATFSSYGPSADGRIKPDVAARGVQNFLTAANGNPNLYERLSGTSFATPLVSGVAACLMQARPTWTPRDVARALRSTASHPDLPDDRTGYGIVDALAALNWTENNEVPPGPPGTVALRLLGAHPIQGDAGPAVLRLALAAGSSPVSGSLALFDVQGRLRRKLWSGRLTPGLTMQVTWDGRDDDGVEMDSGLYWARFVAPGRDQTLRLVYVR